MHKQTNKSVFLVWDLLINHLISLIPYSKTVLFIFLSIKTYLDLCKVAELEKADVVTKLGKRWNLLYCMIRHDKPPEEL